MFCKNGIEYFFTNGSSFNFNKNEPPPDPTSNKLLQFFKSANYLYPFGILVLKKIKKTTRENAEKEFFFDVDSLTKDYMSFMRQNGVINQSFFKGTFIGDDLNFCNEIRAAIETTISETKKN